MSGTVVLYAGLALGFVGALSLLRPLRFLRIPTRRRAAAVLALGALLSLTGMLLPARQNRVLTPSTRLDGFVPAWQFGERHEIRIDASPARVEAALRAVTARQIRLFRLLTWIRRPHIPPNRGPDNILMAPADEPILDVALRSGFFLLAEEPEREIVFGTLVVVPPELRRLAPEERERLRAGWSPEKFKHLADAGYAKAAMNFALVDEGDGSTRLVTETRVFATDAATRRRFAAYWRLIYPGSSLIRRTWLAAIRDHAEAEPEETASSVGAFPDLEPTDFSYVSQELIEAFQNEALQKSIEPFKIFDNLYYVGIEWVASYLLVTDEGLILIDSLHEPYIETGVDSIRRLGFDPEDVRYVVGTHGHFDHMGGHAYYQRTFGARVGLAAADWKRAQTDADQPIFGMELAEPEWVIQEGETLTLGEQTIKFYITPGHTEGVLSMEFRVWDGDDEYRAVMFGGGRARGNDVSKQQTVLSNIRRFQTLAAQSPPFRVRLPGHPFDPAGPGGAGLFFELQRQLQDRSATDPHPFVEEPGVFIEYLELAAQKAEQALLD